ncbi:MAG: transposase family protein, partial [Gammaproteobacteria bacterium]|nr:transposase family protein [Gammaproteobacteria bacterium]
ETVPVTAIPPPHRPWQKISIDITGPFHTAPKHQRYIVVTMWYFSKYPEVVLFTNDITSHKIIDWLEELFARYGNPDTVISDNGPQFLSVEFLEFLHAKNIHHQRFPVYTPMQNGLVEIFNRSLKYGDQVINTQETSLKSGILTLLASFRSTATEHGQTPSELLFGWNIRIDFDS